MREVYFLVAVNGADRVGGFYDVGANDNLTDVYGTWFAKAGIKSTMAGVTLNRTWQKVPISTYGVTEDSKLTIRLQDIPPLQSELYRVSTLPDLGANRSDCGNNNANGTGIGYASETGTIYSCSQPNAYVQLSGPDDIITYGHDEEGEDSATNFDFLDANNGIGYSMRAVNTLYTSDTDSNGGSNGSNCGCSAK